MYQPHSAESKAYFHQSNSRCLHGRSALTGLEWFESVNTTLFMEAFIEARGSLRFQLRLTKVGRVKTVQVHDGALDSQFRASMYRNTQENYGWSCRTIPLIYLAGCFL